MLTLGRLFNKDFEVAQFPDGSFLSLLFKILRNSSSVFSSASSSTSKASASSPNSKCFAARLRICPKQRNRRSAGLIVLTFSPNSSSRRESIAVTAVLLFVALSSWKYPIFSLIPYSLTTSKRHLAIFDPLCLPITSGRPMRALRISPEESHQWATTPRYARFPAGLVQRSNDR